MYNRFCYRKCAWPTPWGGFPTPPVNLTIRSSVFLPGNLVPTSANSTATPSSPNHQNRYEWCCALYAVLSNRSRFLLPPTLQPSRVLQPGYTPCDYSRNWSWLWSERFLTKTSFDRQLSTQLQILRQHHFSRLLNILRITSLTNPFFFTTIVIHNTSIHIQTLHLLHPLHPTRIVGMRAYMLYKVWFGDLEYKWTYLSILISYSIWTTQSIHIFLILQL